VDEVWLCMYWCYPACNWVGGGTFFEFDITKLDITDVLCIQRTLLATGTLHIVTCICNAAMFVVCPIFVSVKICMVCVCVECFVHSGTDTAFKPHALTIAS